MTKQNLKIWNITKKNYIKNRRKKNFKQAMISLRGLQMKVYFELNSYIFYFLWFPLLLFHCNIWELWSSYTRCDIGNHCNNWHVTKEAIIDVVYFSMEKVLLYWSVGQYMNVILEHLKSLKLICQFEHVLYLCGSFEGITTIKLWLKKDLNRLSVVYVDS